MRTAFVISAAPLPSARRVSRVPSPSPPACMRCCTGSILLRRWAAFDVLCGPRGSLTLSEAPFCARPLRGVYSLPFASLSVIPLPVTAAIAFPRACLVWSVAYSVFIALRYLPSHRAVGRSLRDVAEFILSDETPFAFPVAAFIFFHVAKSASGVDATSPLPPTGHCLLVTRSAHVFDECARTDPACFLCSPIFLVSSSFIPLRRRTEE